MMIAKLAGQISLLVFLAALLAANSHATGDPAPDILVRLGAKAYAQRQEATVQLLQDHTLTQSRIMDLYSQAQSHEQRNRLLLVARHQLLRAIRIENIQAVDGGSLGIRQHFLGTRKLAHLRQPAILVVDTLPGFPAHEQLQSGDLILELDGRKANTQGDPIEKFTNLIKSKRPGNLVNLTILRDDVALKVNVRLASRTSLDAMYPHRNQVIPGPAEPRLAPQYEQQWQKLREHLISLGPPGRTLVVDRNLPG